MLAFKHLLHFIEVYIALKSNLGVNLLSRTSCLTRKRHLVMISVSVQSGKYRKVLIIILISVGYDFVGVLFTLESTK